MKRNMVTATVIIAGFMAAAAPAVGGAEVASAAPAAKREAAVPAVQKQETAKPGVGEKPADEPRVKLEVPLLSPAFSSVPVAMVNDDPVTLGELNNALTAVHMSAGEGMNAGKADYIDVLNRIINARLIPLEAEAMGLQDLADIRKQLDANPEAQLREELKEQRVATVKADPAEVQKLYREAVREWRVKSVRFDKEEDAKELARQIQLGGDFDKLADALIDAKKVQGDKEAGYVKPAELLPQVAAFLATADKGAVSPVIAVGPAFTIVKLVDTRYPEGDEKALAEANRKALGAKQLQALEALNKELKKRYAVIDRKLVDKLDFEAKKPGYAALLKDKRAIVRIKGEKPVTVADLAEAMKPKFFHGVDEAIKEKRANEQKLPVLEDILYKRLYLRESRRLGLDKTESYKKKLREFHDSVLFNAFIQKAVLPDLKVTLDDVKKYFDEHVSDYSFPEMMKIRSLVFTKRSFADAAAGNLRKGAEFPWLAANADGQAGDENGTLMHLDGSLVITKNLPDQVRQLVSGARKGDVRLMDSADGYSYLFLVDDVVAAKPQPLDDVKKGISQKVAGVKLAKAVEEWGTKLRQAYKVKIYIATAAGTNAK